MVKQDWMEHLIINFEKARNQKDWNNTKEKKFRYLLELYHTGRFNNISKQSITQVLCNSR